MYNEKVCIYYNFSVVWSCKNAVKNRKGKGASGRIRKTSLNMVLGKSSLGRWHLKR